MYGGETLNIIKRDKKTIVKAIIFKVIWESQTNMTNYSLLIKLGKMCN